MDDKLPTIETGLVERASNRAAGYRLGAIAHQGHCIVVATIQRWCHRTKCGAQRRRCLRQDRKAGKGSEITP
jgi:hypothetical protein